MNLFIRKRRTDLEQAMESLCHDYHKRSSDNVMSTLVLAFRISSWPFKKHFSNIQSLFYLYIQVKDLFEFLHFSSRKMLHEFKVNIKLCLLIVSYQNVSFKNSFFSFYLEFYEPEIQLLECSHSVFF